MKKLFVFLISFVLGIGAVFLGEVKPDSGTNSIPAIALDGVRADCFDYAKLEDNLEIRIRDTKAISEGKDLEVVLTNRSCRVFSYSAYEKASPVFTFKQNDSIGPHWCGTGLNEYDLIPGETVSFGISRHMIMDRFDANDKFRVGVWVENNGTYLWTNELSVRELRDQKQKD